jgi:hypothetical protein
MKWRPASGPLVARLFHRLLAVVFLIAWLSLIVQVRTLFGSSGLLSIDEYLTLARQEGAPWWEIPSLFWISSADGTLLVTCIIGIALSILAFFRWPRVCHGLNTLLYLSFVTGGPIFLEFQWDNLLVECGAFVVFLPRDRRAPWIHTLFRLLLFKLYFESGIAKWESPLHDWRDGSAMTFYYETAPLPTFLAWYAHHLPVWWHHVESWATLFVELVVPFFIFGPRPLRLGAAATFTFFQLINAATGNYGFFIPLALCLHVFCLDDADLARLRMKPAQAPPPLSPRRKRLELATAIVVVSLFAVISLVDGAVHFAGFRGWVAARRIWTGFRIVNTYHLFAAITRERIEPEFQTRVGGQWQARDFRYKPGDVMRRPRLVAPHMPRVDWQLWFYGLDFQRDTPPWVVNLLDRLCNDPEVVQPLFPAPLPPKPEAVRLLFWQYHFTSADEKHRTGAWWTREKIAEPRPIDCPP